MLRVSDLSGAGVVVGYPRRTKVAPLGQLSSDPAPTPDPEPSGSAPSGELRIIKKAPAMIFDSRPRLRFGLV
jgi:hypothetical protein